MKNLVFQDNAVEPKAVSAPRTAKSKWRVWNAMAHLSIAAVQVLCVLLVLFFLLPPKGLAFLETVDAVRDVWSIMAIVLFFVYPFAATVCNGITVLLSAVALIFRGSKVLNVTFIALAIVYEAVIAFNYIQWLYYARGGV